ncbi:MAG: transposase [Synechococcus sp.]|nr:transposase [Synechococcus sp.]
MYRAYQYRLYPTADQQVSLAKSFGCACWFWNYALHLCQQTYQATGKGLSRGYLQGLLPDLKKEHEWLKEAYSQCLQVVALNLSTAYTKFLTLPAKHLFCWMQFLLNQEACVLPKFISPINTRCFVVSSCCC